MRWWKGLGTRITVASILALVLVVWAANWLSAAATSERMEAQLNSAADGIVARLQLSLIEPVWNLNTDQANKLVAVELNFPGLIAAQVSDESGTQIVGLRQRETEDGELLEFTEPPASFYLTREAKIDREGESIGTIRLWLSDITIQQELDAASSADMRKFAGVGIALVLILNLLLRRWVTTPLGQMSQIIGKLVELKPGESLEQISRQQSALKARYGRDSSETGQLTRSLDRFVDLFGELKETTDSAQRAGRGLTCASANLALLDRDGCLVLLNDAFANYLHKEPDVADALGACEGELTGKCKVAESLAAKIGQSLPSLQAPLNLECELAHAHGSLDISPVASTSGERLGYVVQWYDMTEELKQQQLERRIAQELSTVVAAATVGDLKARIQVGDEKGVLAQLAQQVNSLLSGFDNALVKIQDMHHALAAGDLTHRMQEPSWQGAFADVRDNANETLQRLSELVSSLREAAKSVANHAAEIRTSTDDLSRRIEAQAASLEQSAANMKELTDLVGENERDSRDSSQQSTVADEAAQQGGETISRMQSRMSEIGKGSRRIMEIVQLIDDIAFQTNLLALNAAVEAARAGDMGRGFAVVATEVRALAKRAADNAKDIRALLSSSDGEVQQGIRLAGELSTAIASISEAVGSSSRLARKIAEATSQQANSIREVQTVISDLDNITQQNSGIAERTAGVSASLDEKAEVVMSMLARFQLDTTGSSKPSAKKEKRR
ncbi:methyl-accepting chemotaxis protein [Pseudomarimonas arenosa]|uniref:Methyl-accepting chemotaxis protein n=1 Tax=Pseudomarimonas arenosa TaxID=2774145 RepID=A0AAW3ZPA7_9GAMM|nr:methyl-accepting chemotaxis protein [Pseudomarimonas arenosa]MBD8527788.1 hypothetical protein [Pseudomarimonas arenosa]